MAFGAGESSATLTVRTDDDAVAEPASVVTATVTAGSGYAVAQTVTVLDDDTRGVEVSASEAAVPEGGSATYTVNLASQPTAPVDVTLSVEPEDADVTVAPESLRFGATDWHTPVTVTVTAAHDDDGVDDRATVDHAFAGGDYAGLAANGGRDGRR